MLSLRPSTTTRRRSHIKDDVKFPFVCLIPHIYTERLNVFYKNGHAFWNSTGTCCGCLYELSALVVRKVNRRSKLTMFVFSHNVITSCWESKQAQEMYNLENHNKRQVNVTKNITTKFHARWTLPNGWIVNED